MSVIHRAPPPTPAFSAAPMVAPPPLVIGPYTLSPPLVLAPMAGVTDRPFRMLCRRMGAGLAVSEMTSADVSLRDTDKSRLRRDHAGEPAPISVQIAGYDPEMIADAARYNIDHGAQIIDINLGCPAKKVCRVDAGSALMRDPALVERICAATVRAAGRVPVTLKMRTGWAPGQRNAVEIARLAEGAGIAALAVHGRSREQRYDGVADYRTIADVCAVVGIPVIANGDIDGLDKACRVLAGTGCAAVMVGRAALGRPWLFTELAAGLSGRAPPPRPTLQQRGELLVEHLRELLAFYGEPRGVRVARKHIQWALDAEPGGERLWPSLARLDDPRAQRAAVEAAFRQLADPSSQSDLAAA